MAKQLEDYNKDLSKALETMQEYVKAYTDAEKQLNDLRKAGVDKKIKAHQKATKAEREAIKANKELTEEQKKQKLEDKKSDEERDKEKLEKQKKTNKELYDGAKKYYSEVNTAFVESNKKQHAEELLKIKDSKELGGEDLKNRIETNNEIIEEQKRFAEQIKGLDKELTDADPKLAKDTAKAAKKKTTDEWKEKYTGVAKQTEEWTKDIGAAATTVLDASTKFLDAQIARSKEKLDEVKKKLENVQKEIILLKQDSAKVLAEAKAEIKKEYADDVDNDTSIAAEDKDGEKNKRYAELEELEAFHNQKAEIEQLNAEREEWDMEERASLTTEQANRYNELIGKHGDYAQSLDTKSQADTEADKKEKDLISEKEKLEKDIEKAEKKKKKIEFAKQIITASINIAQGVTKAWGLGPIIGPIMAGIVGAAGAVQLAVMSSQSKKFQDGGLLHGSRHSAGGMRIQGSNIEVEGGEYVVNRQSTDKNLGLIRYINSQRKALTPSDIHSFFAGSPQTFEPPFRQAFAQGGQLPSMEPTTNIDHQLLVQAIQGIRFEPKVSVTDINAVQTDVVKVDAWTGM